MPTANFYPSNLQWVGAAKETTYGTPIATPTFWIPVDQSSIKWKPDQATLPDMALRGLMGMEYQQVAGMRTDTLAYKTFPYMDSLYQQFIALFGTTDAVTGAGDPWTHKTSLYNGSGSDSAQPKSYTLFWADAAGKVWQTPGAVVDSLKITVKVDELIAIEPVWRGMPSTAITPPSNTPSTNKPFPSWNGVISLAGSPVGDTSEIALEYKRTADPIKTINNSHSPLAVGAFGLQVAGTGTFVYQGSTDLRLVDFLANTQPALSVKIAPAGDAVHSLTLQHSVIAFDSVDPQSSQKWMEIVAAWKCLMNATDALDTKQSPGQAIFLNAAAAPF